MKKLLFRLAFFTMLGVSHGATQVYIPSTSTYHNYIINVETGTIRNLNTTTMTITNAQISGGTVTLSGLTVVRSTITTLNISGTTGSTLKVNGSDFVVNSTSKTVGIGTASPASWTGTPNGATTLEIKGTGSSNAGTLQLTNPDGGSGLSMGDILFTTLGGGSTTTAITKITSVQDGNQNSSRFEISTMLNGAAATKKLIITSTGTNIVTSTLNVSVPIVPGSSFPSTGTVLTAQGGGLPPIWSYGGKILQIAQYSLVGASGTTTSAFIPTTLTGSFTPFNAGSTICVVASGVLSASANNVDAAATIARNATNIYAGSNGGCEVLSSAGGGTFMNCTLVITDFPNTASAVTYDVRIKNIGGAGTAQWGDTNFQSNLIVIEIGR